MLDDNVEVVAEMSAKEKQEFFAVMGAMLYQAQ